MEFPSHIKPFMTAEIPSHIKPFSYYRKMETLRSYYTILLWHESSQETLRQNWIKFIKLFGSFCVKHFYDRTFRYFVYM